jgi:hypothetical protein
MSLDTRQPDDNPYSAPSPLSSMPGGISPFVESAASEGVTQKTLDLLRQTRPWVRFLSVLGLIASLFFLIGTGAVAVTMFSGGAPPGFPPFVFLIYIPMALLALMSATYLFRYASRINGLLRDPRPVKLEAALQAQKSFWKLAGIVGLLFLVLYVALIGVIGLTVRSSPRATTTVGS